MFDYDFNSYHDHKHDELLEKLWDIYQEYLKTAHEDFMGFDEFIDMKIEELEERKIQSYDYEGDQDYVV